MADFPNSRASLVRHLRLAALGLITGLVAVVFRLALDAAGQARLLLIDRVGNLPGFFVSVALALVTVPLAVWLVRRFCPEAAGSGIPDVKALARNPVPIRWFRLLLVKFSSGVAGIGGGLALGREGPTVQMGTAIGEMLAGRSARPGERRQLLILGAGCGLAGAFNAPLAGSLFVFEELGEEFNSGTCFAALLSTFTADLVCRHFTGQLPQLGIVPPGAPPLPQLPCFLLLGWLAGVLGVAFNQSLLLTMRLGKKGRFTQRLLTVAVALSVGVIGWLDERWVGGGARLLEGFREANTDLRLALGLLSLRFALTIGSYATGAAGGLFAPLLVLGALLGAGVADASGATDHRAFVVVGMAALFTGIVRAPWTAVLLMIEMTGAYNLIVPLLAACLMAKAIADALGDVPIYEALLDARMATTEPPR